jgi:hypothetical protein
MIFIIKLIFKKINSDSDANEDALRYTTEIWIVELKNMLRCEIDPNLLSPTKMVKLPPLDSLCSWVEYALPGLFHSTQASFGQLWRELLGRLPCVGWMWLDFVAVCIAQGEKTHFTWFFHVKFFSNLFSLNNRNSPWKNIQWDSHPSNSRLGALSLIDHITPSPPPSQKIE